jgi:predicted Fe-Mo cluster-binding NifX family protein
MKVAVTAQGKSIDDKLDPRFGRAKYLLIVDTETMEYQALENTQNLDLPQGAGIQAAQNVINEGVGAVVTGNCGPKAFTTLTAARVEVYIGAQGTVRGAVQDFISGSLTKADQANVEGHWV